MSRRKIKLEHPPIIIGDRAMELHKLMPSAHQQSDLLHLMVSATDYVALHEKYAASEVNLSWCKHVADEDGVMYYVQWYRFDYEKLQPSAVKIKNKLVVDKQSLLFMTLLPALDRKNRMPRSTTKKYISDMTEIANTFID